MKIARTTRIMRIFLVGAGLLGTFYALFIAIEDWRGDRVLARERARITAEGDSLDPADYFPKAVPADRNFMALPFLKMLVEDGPAHPEMRQRWTVFARRFEQFDIPNGSWNSGRREEFKVRIAGDSPRDRAARKILTPQETLAVFDPIDSDIMEVRERARSCPFSQFEGDRDGKSAQLGQFFTLSKAIKLHGLAELRLGRGGEAFSDAVVLMRMAEAGDSGPTLLDTLVGRAIGGELTQVFWEGWIEGAWNDDDLRSFHDFYASLDPWSDLIRGFKADRARAIATLSSREWRALIGNSGTLWRKISFLLPRGWISQNAAAASRYFDAILSQYDTSEHRIRLIAENPGKDNDAFVDPFIGPPWFIARGLARIFRGAAEQAPYADIGATVASLELFRRENGHCPATLDELTPKFLRAVPHSVLTGMRPDYGRLDSERFRLSSAGWSEGAKPPAWVWRASYPADDRPLPSQNP